MKVERAKVLRAAVLREGGLALGVSFLAALYLFAPLVAGVFNGHPRFFEWDVPEQYWADLVYLCEGLHEGQISAWNPYDRGGYPYYADPQAAPYHPANWLICAVAGPAPALYWTEARVFAGFMLAGFFAYLWLRRLRASRGAAAAASVLVMAGPFMRSNWELNLTFALAFLPAVLWALEGVLVRRRARDAGALCLAFACLCWAGSPPALWLGLSFATLYTLGRLIEVARGEGRAALLRALGWLGVAALIGVALCAVVVVPGLELAHHSVQAGRSFESISEGGLPLDHLAALASPRDGNHLYFGLTALALMPFAFFSRGARRGHLPGRWVLLLLVVLGAALALGANTPLFRLAFDWVPGVRMFRAPLRYEAWLGPAAAALLAASLDLLQGRLAKLGAQASVVAALGLVCAVGALVLLSAPGVAALALTLAALAAGAVTGRELARTLAGVGIALIMVVDVSQRLNPERHTRERPAPGQDDVAARVLARAPDTEHDFRMMDEFGVSCRAGTRYGRRDLRGYQDPLLLHSYERVVGSLREAPLLAAQFNVRYALTGPHFIHGWDRHYLPPPAELLALEGARDAGLGVIELTSALPFAYFVEESAVEHIASRQDALARLTQIAPARVALVEPQSASPPLRVGAMSQRPPSELVVDASSVAVSRDALQFHIDAPSRGVVVVNEAWYPGWRAEVDGVDTPIYRAASWVRAIPVEAGAHHVHMRFEPPDLVWLRGLLALGWSLALGLLLWPAPRRRGVRSKAGRA